MCHIYVHQAVSRCLNQKEQDQDANHMIELLIYHARAQPNCAFRQLDLTALITIQKVWNNTLEWKQHSPLSTIDNSSAHPSFWKMK